MPTSTFHNLPAAKRRRLVDAAIAEFAAHPYAEASLDRIAQRARVSKGSLYQYFDDKADLFRHLVLTELAARRVEAITPALAGGTVFERIEAMFLRGLSAFREDPRAAALGARLHEDGGPATRAIKEEVRERGVAFFRAELDAALGRGELREDVDVELAARLVATIAGPGLVDALSARLGLTLAEIARARTPIDDAAVRATVRAAIDIVAGGLGRPSSPTRRTRRRPR